MNRKYIDRLKEVEETISKDGIFWWMCGWWIDLCEYCACSYLYDEGSDSSSTSSSSDIEIIDPDMIMDASEPQESDDEDISISCLLTEKNSLECEDSHEKELNQEEEKFVASEVDGLEPGPQIEDIYVPEIQKEDEMTKFESNQEEDKIITSPKADAKLSSPVENMSTSETIKEDEITKTESNQEEEKLITSPKDGIKVNSPVKNISTSETIKENKNKKIESNQVEEKLVASPKADSKVNPPVENEENKKTESNQEKRITSPQSDSKPSSPAESMSISETIKKSDSKPTEEKVNEACPHGKGFAMITSLINESLAQRKLVITSITEDPLDNNIIKQLDSIKLDRFYTHYSPNILKSFFTFSKGQSKKKTKNKEKSQSSPCLTAPLPENGLLQAPEGKENRLKLKKNLKKPEPAPQTKNTTKKEKPTQLPPRSNHSSSATSIKRPIESKYSLPHSYSLFLVQRNESTRNRQSI